MENFSNKLFICFSAKDRYSIVQPLVYHLKNYGINVWYDRYDMVLGDDRVKKNLEEGAGKCRYALIVLSNNTIKSSCAIEEIKILESRYTRKEVVIFPVLYEIKPIQIHPIFEWIRNLIFKEADHTTGTLEICNHIACKITQDMLSSYKYKTIKEIINSGLHLPKSVFSLLNKYIQIDNANLNSKVSILYAIYIVIVESCDQAMVLVNDVPSKVFERLFTETLLNLTVDYRELWLLENSFCLLANYYFASCTESKI